MVLASRISTPIIDQVEKLHPEPSIHPTEPATQFISALIEEFGDEWGNKWMFHYRWARDVDQISSAGRIARMRAPKSSEQEHEAFAQQVRARMVDRVWFVGSNAVTAPQIEASFQEMLGLLETHLATRPYLFGARPAYGDFGLWGQFYEMWTDPTVGALIGGDAPHVLDWIHRMLWPRAEGAFEPWTALAPTLMPILTRQVGRQFWPWMLANETLARRRQGRIQCRAWRQGLDAEAAEISREIARHAAREVCRHSRQAGSRPDPRGRGLPCGIARLDTRSRPSRGQRPWNCRNTRLP